MINGYLNDGNLLISKKAFFGLYIKTAEYDLKKLKATESRYIFTFNNLIDTIAVNTTKEYMLFFASDGVPVYRLYYAEAKSQKYKDLKQFFDPIDSIQINDMTEYFIP